MVKLFFFLFLCSSSHPVFAQEAQQDTSVSDEKKVEEITGQKRISAIQRFLQPFEYDREVYRDPFETQGFVNPLEPGQVYGPFLKLQNYRLSDFRLKGLLWGIKDPVAVFRAPDKKDYRLRIKDYIGENFGYVAMIREKEVVVIQTIEEDGKRYSTTKVVFLDKKEKR
jgi:Tfp pilus assembly protein PilP